MLALVLMLVLVLLLLLLVPRPCAVSMTPTRVRVREGATELSGRADGAKSVLGTRRPSLIPPLPRGSLRLVLLVLLFLSPCMVDERGPVG